MLLARVGRGLQEGLQPLAALQTISGATGSFLSSSGATSIHTSSHDAAESQPTASTSSSLPFLGKTNNREAQRHFRKYRYNKPSQSDLKELLHSYTATQGHLPGQHILAKVLKMNGRKVIIDPQFFGLNMLDQDDLAGTELYDQYGNPKQGVNAGLMHPGDYIKVKLTHLYTPYGDMQLEPSRLTDESKMKLIWQELSQAQAAGTPVQGRVLNACKGGYAVGVAGFVALLPYSKCLPDTAQKIGVLQEFFIMKMDEARQVMLISCTKPPAAGSSGSSGSNLDSLYSNIPPQPASLSGLADLE
jgi:hypothetical protein